jgi:hypothetical protein
MFNPVYFAPNRFGLVGNFNFTGGQNLQNSRARQRFTREEDARLLQLVETLPGAPWDEIARQLPGRTARQVRERYRHYLCPELNLGAWTTEEESLLRATFEEHGPQWSILKSYFPNRSAVNVKNHWTTMIARDSREAWEHRTTAQVVDAAEPAPADDGQDIFDFHALQQKEPTALDPFSDPFLSCA